MKIETLPTVEILDWEKENGLEIIVTKNEAENNFEAKIKGFYTDEILFKYFSPEFGAKAYGKSIDDSLQKLCKKISNTSITTIPLGIMLPSKPIRVEREIRCPLLVHTKLIEPEGKHVHIPKVEDWVDKYLANDNKPEPLIGAEGWEQIDMSFQEESYYYKSKVYKYTNLRYDLKEESIFIHSGFILTITIFVNDFMAFKEKANLQENDSLQGQCFKIANYICSRLCDKIEK